MDSREKNEYEKKLKRLEKEARADDVRFKIRQQVRRREIEMGSKAPAIVREVSEVLEIAGMHIVHKTYENPIWQGFKRSDDSINEGVLKRKESQKIRKEMEEELKCYAEKYPNAKKEDKEAIAELEEIKKKYAEVLSRREDNVKRQVDELRDVINANWKHWSHFITLTFKENLVDIELARSRFKDWTKKMCALYDDFIYCYVIEFQARGAVHFHVIVRIKNGKLVGKTEFMKIRNTWNFGSINIKGIAQKYKKEVPKKIKDATNEELKLEEVEDDVKIVYVWSLGNYLTGYMKKEAGNVLLFGQKMFGTSAKEKLEKKIVIRDKKIIDRAVGELELDRLKKKEYVIEQKETENTITMSYYNKLIIEDDVKTPKDTKNK